MADDVAFLVLFVQTALLVALVSLGVSALLPKKFIERAADWIFRL